jgi:hypothetical protein
MFLIPPDLRATPTQLQDWVFERRPATLAANWCGEWALHD